MDEKVRAFGEENLPVGSQSLSKISLNVIFVEEIVSKEVLVGSSYLKAIRVTLPFQG
jgi:hypothetical protein